MKAQRTCSKCEKRAVPRLVKLAGTVRAVCRYCGTAFKKDKR